MSSSPPLTLPARSTDAHKGAFGRALLIGGSRGMSGSIALSSIAALRSGSGLVTAAVPDRCLETVASFHPGVMTMPLADENEGHFSIDAAAQLAGKLAPFDAIGCGPGMTTNAGSVRLLERLLDSAVAPLVLDADAINALAILDWPNQTNASAANVVLTPHPGEFERLTDCSAKQRDDQISAAQQLSARTGAIIVLKGGPTVVTGPEQTWTNDTGNPGMATAGSGDVLTGIITSLLGQRLTTWDAARLGVWIHGQAGDIAANCKGHPGMTCVDIADALPAAVLSATASE